MVERVETGVDGLDELLGGGLVRDSTVLVTGSPGTGKSILGLQYIYNGVEQYDEPGIYLTFEEDAADLEAAAESIGFDRWAEHVENGDITVHDKQQLLREEDMEGTLDLLLEDIDGGDYRRLVLDSLTMFQLFFADEREQRTYLLKFSDILKRNGLTCLFINEQGGMYPESGVGLENFLTDGNVYLVQAPADGGVNRFVWITKMRKIDVDTDVYPMEIDQGGIKVYSNATAFWSGAEESAEDTFGF